MSWRGYPRSVALRQAKTNQFKFRGDSKTTRIEEFDRTSRVKRRRKKLLMKLDTA